MVVGAGCGSTTCDGVDEGVGFGSTIGCELGFGDGLGSAMVEWVDGATSFGGAGAGSVGVETGFGMNVCAEAVFVDDGVSRSAESLGDDDCTEGGAAADVSTGVSTGGSVGCSVLTTGAEDSVATGSLL